MDSLLRFKNSVIGALNEVGDTAALLPIRLLMAYEFGRAGMMKLNGNNWFANVQDDFPFPFNVMPVEISWVMATWVEILGAAGLVLGLFTRFWALGLIVVTIVAIFGVHMPDDWNSLAELWKGYAITDKGFGNFRVPLLFLVMLVPLVLTGPGKISVDHFLAKRF
ncbi:MAG: DoxX family protein [Gammaproteobacteria bacterium]|nr:DoxX family protein [Gammaproteobacteria bacterium]